MADAEIDDEGSRGKRNDAGGGSSAESEAESTSAPTASGDAFLDAVKGISDDAAVEFDQYAPAPAATSTSSSSAAAAAAAGSAASANNPAPPKPPSHAAAAPGPSLSRRSSMVSSPALTEEESAAKAAALEAKRLADAERRKELVAQLEQLSETLKVYEREHDFFYTGLSGWGIFCGMVVFLSTWVTGLSGSLSLGTATAGRSRAIQITNAAAGIMGGLFSTAQRVWSPAVRSQYYKNARDDYARLRKKCKAALGGNSDGSGEASLAALESAVRSISAKAGERFLSSFLFFFFLVLLCSRLCAEGGREKRERERKSSSRCFFFLSLDGKKKTFFLNLFLFFYFFFKNQIHSHFSDDLYERSPDIPVDADGFLLEHGRLSYSILLGFGAAFYPCAACCSPAGPKKPADGRGGGRDDLV